MERRKEGGKENVLEGREREGERERERKREFRKLKGRKS